MSIARILSMCHRLRAVFWFALGWLAVSPAARAYVLENSTWALGAPITLNLQLGAPAAPLMDGSTTWDQVAEAAADEWNPFLGNGVQFQINTDVFTPRRGDGRNTVFFSGTIYGEGFDEDTLAVTILVSGQTVTTESDVIVNSAQSFDSYLGRLRYIAGRPFYDLRRVLIHEFGHVLGLGHTTQGSRSIMAPVISSFDTVQDDDIAGVASIYVNPQHFLPTITSPATTGGVPGQPFQFQVQASGDPIRFIATGLPAGLSINAATGLITGTPAAEGVSVAQLSVSNRHGTAGASLTITILYAPVITSPLAVTAIVGVPFSYQTTATNGPASFGVSGPPPVVTGLSYDQRTGVLSGVPLSPGRSTYTLGASNAAATGHADLIIDFVYDGPYVLHTFAPVEGGSVFSALTQASDGNFYGTLHGGYGATLGLPDPGFVFRLTPAGDVTVLHSFVPSSSVPVASDTGVVEGLDGNLYGTCPTGGANGAGTFFRITPTGTLTVLHDFGGNSGGLVNPLARGRDGNFYGTTYPPGGAYGGNSNFGTIFRLTPDGVYTLLHTFEAADYGRPGGASPSGLVQAGDGNFYGVCLQGGENWRGTIFRISPEGNFDTIYMFPNSLTLCYPMGTPVLGTDGSLYGTAGTFVSSTSFYRCTLDGSLTARTTTPYDGEYYSNGLTAGGDGYIYGSSSYRIGDGSYTLGLIKYAPDGTRAEVIHTFTTQEGTLTHPMIRAADGGFYGVTSNNEVLRIFPGVVPPGKSYVSVVPKVPEAHPAPGAAGVFTLRRDNGSSTGPLTVGLSYDGNARGDVDYAALPNTVTIPDGAATFDCRVVSVNPALGSTPAVVNVHVKTGEGYTVNPNARDTQVRIYGNSSVGPAFFSGEVLISEEVYYLTLPDSGNVFGYYTYLADSRFIYHFDLGFEYWIDAADGHNGIYFYDFASQDFFYTSPTFPFPYLYDFNLRSFLYYYPDPTNPQRYNTGGVRYFYNFATGRVISK